MIGLLLALLLQAIDAEAPETPAATETSSKAAAPRKATAPKPPGDPMGTYLADLEKAGVVTADKEPATLERLKRELAAAEDDLVTGNAEVASVRLFRLVESPRYQQFDYAPDYANAELTLARALIRAGGFKSAERYLLRVLGRGPKTQFFAPAYRLMVDIALETREQVAILAVLDHVEQDLAARGAGELPRDSRMEHAYLAGKVAYEKGDPATAEARFSDVDRQSRFYAAALYFRGLINARRGHYAAARRSLCEIVEQIDQSRFTFFIDGRYYGIKDLAFLALGRISHEQGRYDDAYYFYFRVPEDSEKLPDALFEASWSMFQKGEYEAAGAFLDQFDRSFGNGSALAPDVLLLHAMIDLKSCEFDRVRVTLDKLVKTYAPIQARVAKLLKDPAQRNAFYKRLLSRRSIGSPRDPVIELLKVDPRFYKYYNDIVALDREAGRIPAEVAVWDELTAHEAGQPGASNATEAVRLVQDIEALRPLAAGDPVAEQRVSDLADEARRAARLTNVAGGRFAGEAQATLALASAARKLRAELVAATSAIANQALVDLDQRLRELLRRARLTHIDAVIGKKKKLEIEIANLREGRYPAELFATLQLEGLMGDDEEYWPFEGEYWSDEYENFK
jgi:tetratricopeptide (TPR) repeat protein